MLASYESVLFGSYLGITSGQVLALAGVAAGSLAFFAVVGRPLLFASVDGAVAGASGVPTRGLGVAFLLALGLAVAATAQITGVLLVFALLVAPAATAQLVTPRVGVGLALGVALGIVTVWLGVALAYATDYPIGFFITTVATSFYVLARAARALVARPPAWRRRRVAHPPSEGAAAA